MAQQIINNGTFDNDPSAEKIRTAFDKVNANDTELYTTKQATLVSGTNIKTINGTTILGSGDLSTTTLQKTITGNVTLDDTYSDTIVKVKANATITINTGLKTNFNCVFRTFTGATVIFAVGVGVTADAPTGLNLAPFKMATLFKDGAVETYVLTGETT